MGALTALFLACFMYWAWWAFADRNKARLDEASRLPFSDGSES
jgi:cbb3-type cytochrome oxidase subunit 3